MRHDRRLVRERDIVVRILPRGRRRWRAALEVGGRIVAQRADQPLAHLGVADSDFPVVIDELHVVGVHERQERIVRIAGVDAHREAGAEDPLAGFLAVIGLRLVAPECPVFLPRVGNLGVARFGQHVLPVLDVHRLLLDRKAVIRALLRLVVVQVSGLDRVRQKVVLDRRDDVAQVLELAFVRPFAEHLEVVHVDVGHVRRIAGIERGNGLRNAVLHRVLGQVDLDAGLRLELLDGVVQRRVFRWIEPLDPPDDDLFLCCSRCCRAQHAERKQRGEAFHDELHRSLLGRSHLVVAALHARCDGMAAYGRPPGCVNRAPRPTTHITAPTYHGTNSFCP